MLNPWTGKKLWAFDMESHLIQPGLLTPPPVCASWATGQDAGIAPSEQGLDDLEKALLSSVVIATANGAYDFGLACAARPYLIDAVFEKYERGEMFDILIAEALIDIHKGYLFRDPVTFAKFGRYSLALLGARYLGVDMASDKDSTNPDAWRYKYALLEGVPLTQWPRAALEYPIRDARYTYDVAVKQIEDGRNLWDLPDQARAAWALQCSAIWGMRTDAPWVEIFAHDVEQKHHLSRAKFLAAGLLKVRRAAKKDGVLETPEPIDQTALGLAISIEKNPDRKALLRKAQADVLAGRPMKYGGDKKRMAELVTAAYEGEPPMSDKGNVRANQDTLKESGDDLLIEFADSGENEKFFSTYVSVLQQGTRVPINPETNVLVATGRTSYRKPNLQNLPRGGHVREGFVARPGYVFASMDYPTLELRTLAHVLEKIVGESVMAQALRDDVDLHTKLGAEILGVPYASLLARVGAQEKVAKDFRQMSKAGNFGLPGGLGAVKFVTYARDSYEARLCLLSGRATTCGVKKFVDRRAKSAVCAVCFEVAREIKKTWLAAWPEMVRYFEIMTDWTSRETERRFNDEGEQVLTDVGSITQLHSGRVRGRCNFTNGCNTLFQGLAADIAKRAMWLVSRECYTDRASPLWGSRIVVFVHDELFMELPEDRAHEAAFRASHLMDVAGAEKCPTVPWKVKPALARRWYKDMKDVYDAKGRLIPWEPQKKAAEGLTDSTDSI